MSTPDPQLEIDLLLDKLVHTSRCYTLRRITTLLLTTHEAAPRKYEEAVLVGL